MRAAHRPLTTPTEPELRRHETDDVAHDAETVLRFERERSFAHALAGRVPLPNRYRLAIGAKDWLTRDEADIHGALSGNLLTVLVERIQERPDPPQRSLADIPEFGADDVSHFPEPVGELRELAAGEEEAHDVVRLHAAVIPGVGALLMEGIDHLVSRYFELVGKLHKRALLDRRDDHHAARVALTLHSFLLGLRIQALHGGRYDVGIRETELQGDQTDTVIERGHGGPPFFRLDCYTISRKTA